MPISESKKQDYLSTSRQPSFKKIVDIVNCFGHNKKKCKKEFIDNALNTKQRLWFAPFERSEKRYIRLNNDGSQLIESWNKSRTQKTKLKKMMEEETQRVVFAHLKDYKGEDKFRFVGIFIVDKMNSSMENGTLYKKVADTILIEK